MKAPRCGVSDISRYGHFHGKPRWRKRLITYRWLEVTRNAWVTWFAFSQTEMWRSWWYMIEQDHSVHSRSEPESGGCNHCSGLPALQRCHPTEFQTDQQWHCGHHDPLQGWMWVWIKQELFKHSLIKKYSLCLLPLFLSLSPADLFRNPCLWLNYRL